MSDESAAPSVVGDSKSDVLASGLRSMSQWSLRLVLIALGFVLLGLVIAKTWVVLLPVLLAIVMSTVLVPPAMFLRRHRFPAALAAATVTLAAIAVVVLVVSLVAPPVIREAAQVGSQASAGVGRIRDYVTGPPLNFNQQQIDSATQAITQRLQSNASTIAGGVVTGVSTVVSALVTLLLVLVLTFFFVKDGERFLPTIKRYAGDSAGGHLDEVLRRIWKSISGFIRVQALVSLVDGVCIGTGLLVLGVPLALPLAVLTFLGGFIPIVGAVVAGAVAILVALVSGGLTQALIVLAIVLAVQQLEGNVLQPLLQSRNTGLHPAVILLAVTGMGSLFGIPGAFFAVPLASAVTEVLRYANERVDARALG